MTGHALKLIGVAAITLGLAACATTISESDLMRPGFGINPNPTIMPNAPYVNGGNGFSSYSGGACLPAAYRCTLQAPVQRPEAAYY